MISQIHRALCLGVQIPLLNLITLASAHHLSAILPLRATRFGTAFDVEVVIGGQSFEVLADTGSADLWVLESGWKCFKQRSLPTGSGIPHKNCKYGNDTYTQSSTFEPISNAWFGEHYGSGNDIGSLGFEQVQLGNITLPRQEMGFVNMSADLGDGINSGVLGLGYPVLAAVHPADYAANSSFGLLEERWKYDTVFVNLVRQGLEPFFSFALERTPLHQETGFGGYLALGTLPPVPHGKFVPTPVEPTEALPASYVNGTGKISEWTLKVEALTWNGKTNSTPFQAVVDTGTWQNLYPAEVASQINAGFDPPGVWDAEWSSYAVPCNATPPSNVGIQIGGKSFSMNGADMIWQAPTGGCYSSVAPSVGSGDIVLSFLGDAFLKNVVAVFDVGHSEMRFAERQESNSTSAMPTGPSTPSTGSGSSLRVPVGLLVASGVALLALL